MKKVVWSESLRPFCTFIKLLKTGAHFFDNCLYLCIHLQEKNRLYDDVVSIFTVGQL